MTIAYKIVSFPSGHRTGFSCTNILVQEKNLDHVYWNKILLPASRKKDNMKNKFLFLSDLIGYLLYIMHNWLLNIKIY